MVKWISRQSSELELGVRILPRALEQSESDLEQANCFACVEDSKPAAMCEFFREAEKASTARGGLRESAVRQITCRRILPRALEQSESDLEQANFPEIVCEFLKSSYNFEIPLSSLTEIRQ